ncbi:MAG TPA: DUF2334 domain-containing protein [Polyangia bacterium]|nr:DUF2334 domain-containing protein [Polyangia bacterium]
MTLLASIHDVAPPHLEAARRLRDFLGERGVERATLLAVPNFHGVHPLERAGETVRWLRERAAAGDEVCLHGGTHRQERSIGRRGDRLRSALLTAGEGECLALDPAARARLLGDGKRRLEELLGGPVYGFIAPAWLEPRGFGDDVRAAGFRWHEGSLWIESFAAGDGKARRRYAPVIGFATRSRARLLASVAWGTLLAPILACRPPQRRPFARVALHPSDLGSPLVLATAARVLKTLQATCPPTTYQAALAAGAL